jgi:hypothetical protein
MFVRAGHLILVLVPPYFLLPICLLIYMYRRYTYMHIFRRYMVFQVYPFKGYVGPVPTLPVGWIIG